MITRLLRLAFILTILFGLFLNPQMGSANDGTEQTPVVRAVIFYSPTCGHCQKVITEDLPPLFEKYGNQLQIIGIDITTEEGQKLYRTYLENRNIPPERRGVPALVVEDVELIGSGEIPQLLPGIIEEGLKTSGIDWPEIPGLLDIIEQVENQSKTSTNDENVPTITVEEPLVDPTASPEPTSENHMATDVETIPQASETTQPTEISTNPELTDPAEGGFGASIDDTSVTTTLSIPFDDEITMGDRFKQDLAANTLAVVVLVGMIISIIWDLISVIRIKPKKGIDWSWLLPILSILGLFVAGYLSFVEVTETEAVCGPVGDCNSVQQSPYATLFGFLPVGFLGLLGYIAILIVWVIKRYGPESWNNNLTILIWGMALFGVVFSIYLTFLEPFVIGATCMWCISSAIIITLQFWSASEPVRRIWMDTEEDMEE